MTKILLPSLIRGQQHWYKPTFSPEHGVYVILVVSFLTGAAAAQQWTWATTLALLCAYCGFQAEHPLVTQIKRRRNLKLRFLVWVGAYGTIAGAIAIWIYWRSLEHWPLLVIYGAVIAAVIVDCIAAWRRQQKSVLNELITFSAICLSAPLAYVATAEIASVGHSGVETSLFSIFALWSLNALFFSSAIFTVKFRKTPEASIISGLIYHGVAIGLILTFWQLHWLSSITAAAFGVAILKFGFIAWQRDWYCHAPIMQVARVETLASFLFLVITALSLLPATL